MDRNGNVYVADAGNNVIRKIFPDGRTVVFAGSGKMGYADGKSFEATFSMPTALAVDSKGTLYVSDQDLTRWICHARRGGNGSPCSEPLVTTMTMGALQPFIIQWELLWMIPPLETGVYAPGAPRNSLQMERRGR